MVFRAPSLSGSAKALISLPPFSVELTPGAVEAGKLIGAPAINTTR
jgi:hypothetical protein